LRGLVGRRLGRAGAAERQTRQQHHAEQKGEITAHIQSLLDYMKKNGYKDWSLRRITLFGLYPSDYVTIYQSGGSISINPIKKKFIINEHSVIFIME
jgi:hypothetical protein